MDKLSRLKKELKELEEQKKKAEEQLQTSKTHISSKKKEIGSYYEDFFDNKTNKDFVLYQRYPGIEALQFYERQKDRHPLYENGTFNVKELAEIIKNLYQFQRQKEYRILTFGMSEERGMPIYGGQTWDLIPHLYLAIGDDKSLEPYYKFEGLYTNDELILPFMSTALKNAIVLGIKSNAFDTPFDIECLTESFMDVKGKINYIDYLSSNQTRTFSPTVIKNIFPHIMNLYRYQGIKDIFDFNIHKDDSFIARVLLSICIYKRNNGITELSSDDYNHIFETLYNEKVDIKGQAEQDIPKHLTYVPNKKVNR